MAKIMSRHYWIVGRKGGKGFPTIVPKLYGTKQVATWWANLANENSFTPYSDYIAKKVVLVYG